MKIADYKDLTVVPSSDYIAESIGIVLKTQEDTGKNTLGVYIPRIMMGMDLRFGPKEDVHSISYNKVKNSQNRVFGNSSANWQNWIEIPCHSVPNIQLPKYQIGERIKVHYEDQDIRSAFFLPYSVNDLKKRKVDTADFFVSARASDAVELTEDNIYRLRLDSINKKVELVTSKQNGELQLYMLSFDMAAGKIYLGDEKRSFGIDTNSDTIELINEAGTSIQAKEGVLTFTAENVVWNVKEKITVEAESLEETIEDVTRTVKTSLDETIEKHTVAGSKRVDETKNVEESGQNYKRKFSVDVIDSATLNLHGVLGAKKIAWQVPDGGSPLPTAASISDSGAANFASPAPMGMGFAKAQPVISSLSLLAGMVDTLGAMFGIPPTASASISSSSSLIASSFAKG